MRQRYILMRRYSACARAHTHMYKHIHTHTHFTRSTNAHAASLHTNRRPRKIDKTLGLRVDGFGKFGGLQEVFWNNMELAH